jgi:hypothetical protein
VDAEVWYRLEWPAPGASDQVDGWSLVASEDLARSKVVDLLSSGVGWVRVVAVGCRDGRMADLDDVHVDSQTLPHWSGAVSDKPPPSVRPAPPQRERDARRLLTAMRSLLEWAVERSIADRATVEVLMLAVDAAVSGLGERAGSLITPVDPGST